MNFHRLLCRLGLHFYPYGFRRRLDDDTRELKVCAVCGHEENRLILRLPVPTR